MRVGAGHYLLVAGEIAVRAYFAAAAAIAAGIGVGVPFAIGAWLLALIFQSIANCPLIRGH